MITYDSNLYFQLSKDLTFSDKIKPVCLPTSATKDYSGSIHQYLEIFI